MKEFIKKHCFNIIMAIIFILGIAVVAYPTISDYWNSRVQTKAIGDYRRSVENANAAELEKLKFAAQLYNESLYECQTAGRPAAESASDYESVLNINGDGVMGYIEIPLISVELPIYHGTADDILRVAVGHSPSSSLPSGGANTHAVLLGHRGLPTARLFNDLDQLSHGDYFEIYTLGDVLTYEIYKIETVEPKDLNKLRIESGEDLVTLVTCTPYGINSHRLLIHGKRIDSKINSKLLIYSEARKVNTAYVAVAVGIVLWVLAMIVIMYISSRWSRSKLSRDEIIRRREILAKYYEKERKKR